MNKYIKNTSLSLLLLFSGIASLRAADAFTSEEVADQLAQLSVQDPRTLVVQEVQARLKKGEESKQLESNVKRFIKKMKDVSDSNKSTLLADIESIIADGKSCSMATSASDTSKLDGDRVLPLEQNDWLDLGEGDDRVSVLFPSIDLAAMPYALNDTHLVVEQGYAEVFAGERVFMYPLSPCVAVIAKAHDRAFIAHVYTDADLSNLVSKMHDFKSHNGIEEIKMYSVTHPAVKTVKWQKSVLQYIGKAFKEHVVYGSIFSLNEDELSAFKDSTLVDLASCVVKTIMVDHQGTVFHASVTAVCAALGKKTKDYEGLTRAAQKAVWGGRSIPKVFCNAKIPACLLTNLKK